MQRLPASTLCVAEKILAHIAIVFLDLQSVETANHTKRGLRPGTIGLGQWLATASDHKNTLDFHRRVAYHAWLA
jgi:hypothetical protein